MAFEFPRANPKQLFFPTVHIHDGKVRPKATFDHALYCQKRDGEKLSLPDWRESQTIAGQFMTASKAAGVLEADRHCYLKEVKGQRKNEDIVL